MPFVEPPQGIVVGMLPPGQPQVRYLVPAGRLQLSARAYTGHEAVQPHTQQCARMVGWRSHRVTFYVHAKLRLGISIQSIDELGDEPRRMIQRQQLVKRRRQHPHLLSAHRSKRHLNISHLGCRFKPTPHPYTTPTQTSESGSIANLYLWLCGRIPIPGCSECGRPTELRS